MLSSTKIRVARASFVGSADVLAGAAYGTWSRKIRLTLLKLMPALAEPINKPPTALTSRMG
jgi:hypothetical protein